MTGALSVPPWLPNAISLLRVGMVPLWLAVVLGGVTVSRPSITALGVVLAIGLSDVLDGLLARRFHLVSRWGAVLDAVADKLAQMVAFTTLAVVPVAGIHPVPLAFAVLLWARDLLLGIGFSVLRGTGRRVPVEHAWHGRASSVGLFALLILLHLEAAEQILSPLLLSLSVLIVVSTGRYVARGWRVLAAEPAPAPPGGPSG